MYESKSGSCSANSWVESCTNRKHVALCREFIDGCTTWKEVWVKSKIVLIRLEPKLDFEIVVILKPRDRDLRWNDFMSNPPVSNSTVYA